MFINISNHNSTHWGNTQLAAAKAWGGIVDVDFPSIGTESDASAVSALAEQYSTVIRSRFSPDTDAVHIMGEMTFTYALVRRLRQVGFTCLASTTQRLKQQLPDGSFISEFQFHSFRHYE